MKTLEPGDRFAGTRILRLLGEGTQARVYEAMTPEGARRAIKVIDAGPNASRAAARAAQEGQALMTICHVNVVRLYRIGGEDGCVFLLLELVEGESLRAKMNRARGGLPGEELLRWAIQVCEGVAAVHAAGIVHRDLKPENILVTPQDVAKVLDFGFAKLQHLGIATTAGRFVGTALYAPPEQLRAGHGPVHYSWDVFAMGVILYEALAGAHPVDAAGQNDFEICARQLAFHPRPLREVAPLVPGDLAWLVSKAIDLDPSRRPTMGELADGLRDVLHDLVAPQLREARNLVPDARETGAPTEPLPVMSEDRPATAPPHTLAPTVPLPAFAELPSLGDRPALPPPAWLAHKAQPAAAPAPAPIARPSGADRPSNGAAHESSTAPVTAGARPPNGAHGRVAAAILAVLAALVAGVWAWYAGALDPGPRAAAGPAAPWSALPAASAAVPAGSAAPPARRGRGRGPRVP